VRIKTIRIQRRAKKERTKSEQTPVVVLPEKSHGPIEMAAEKILLTLNLIAPQFRGMIFPDFHLL